MIYKKITDWKLNAFYPYVPILKNSAETGGRLSEIFEWIEAKVPGTVYDDLLKAGIIKDPYYGMQSLECEWVKDRWWEYRTDFCVPDTLKNRNVRLRFKGTDYKANFYLDGKNIGTHTGMYTPFVYTLTKEDRDAETLSVVLESAPDEMGQIGYTERTFTQKARFTYKWDWCPRMVHLGIYDDVIIEDFGNAAIEYMYQKPVFENGRWHICCELELTAFSACECKLEFDLSYNEKSIKKTVKKAVLNKGANKLSINLPCDDVKLWYPSGHGKQELYGFEILVSDENGISDSRKTKIGFRTIDYVQCINAEEGSLPYNLVVNGEKIYIKGVNYAPGDMMYGAMSEQKYIGLLESAKAANINLVRVWGGGLIEKEIFYETCDRLGLLVWQEFIQSSSGISNVPSKDKGFLKLCGETAVEAVKTKRNHVSLAFWSGGNELADQNGVPVTFDDENIALLRNVVAKYNREILMLPTSASGPNEFLDIDQPGKNHDVHGPWKYTGTSEHYFLYNKSDSQLHSEFGVDGVANYSTLCEIMPEDQLYPVPMDDHTVWRHHGEWWDTYGRDSRIFGEFGKNEISEFIKCSQFIQAEGLRYALEANRRRAFENCGSIIWQFNEPWPNSSGTNIIDYYLKPKFAYYTLKNAYRPINANFRYDKLTYVKNEVFMPSVYLTSDTKESGLSLACVIKNERNEVLFKKTFNDISVQKGKSTLVESLKVIVNADKFISVSLSVNGRDADSEYLLLVSDSNGYSDKKCVCDYYDKMMGIYHNKS